MKSLVKERDKNGGFKDIISFMQRLNSEIINKRQLEKLIQSGSFDSIEKNRSKLFQNVVKFVDFFSNDQNDKNQNLLFDDESIRFSDKNLFKQDVINWKKGDLLKNELEVIGFYFTSHPLLLYPSNFFKKLNIESFEKIELENKKSYKIAGSILDIKERSNKDGKKYAFITASSKNNQFELTIFSDNLFKYRSYLKEGNVVLFDIEVLRNDQDTRYIIKKIIDFDDYFNKFHKTINIYTSTNIIKEIKEDLFYSNKKINENIFLYTHINNKLVTIDFNKNYSLKSYSLLDNLRNSKKLDYSIDLS